LRARSLIAVAALLAAWELVARLKLAPSFLLPSVSEVVACLIGLVSTGVLTHHYLTSLVRWLLGFTAGSAVGVGLGLGMGLSRGLHDSAFPLIGVIYAVPAVAWIPLLLVWLGLSEALPIAVVFLCSSIPLAIVTLTAVREVSREVVDVARTLGARGLDLLATIMVPQALPTILSGLKVEAGMAWRSCFVAEMIAMPSGLGFLAMEASSMLRVDVVMAVVTVLAASNYVFHALFEKLEVALLRRREGLWSRSS